MDRVDGGLAAPALTSMFPRYGSVSFGDGGGQILGEFKIPPDTLVVGTGEAEHGLGVGEVDLVFDLTALGDPIGIEVLKVNGQGFQLLKCVRQAGGGFNALAFLLTEFPPSAAFVSVLNAILSVEFGDQCQQERELRNILSSTSPPSTLTINIHQIDGIATRRRAMCVWRKDKPMKPSLGREEEPYQTKCRIQKHRGQPPQRTTTLPMQTWAG